MPQTPRHTPATSGPGRGTPRSRTTARPGERTNKPRVRPLDPDDVPQALSDEPTPAPRAQRAMTATWRLAVLIVVIAGIALVLANSLRVYFAQASELSAVRAQIADEQERIADLQDKLDRWNDDEYVKAIARVRLGWVMPGETGYHVIGADGQPLEGSTMGQAPEEQGLWWEKMWRSVQLADAPEEDPASSPAPRPTPSPTASPTP